MAYKARVLNSSAGGTGVANADASTITLGGALTTSGAFASTFTMSNTTAVTFPTSGTLATTSQLTSGTVTSVSGTTNQVAVATGTTTPVISLVGPYTPATYTAHGVLVGEGTSSIAALAAGSAGQVLQSGGASADPAYSTSTYPATNAVNTLLYASSANVMSALATANNGVLATDGSGVPSITATPTITSVTLTGSGLSPLNMVSTDAGAGAGPIADFYRNSASPAAADVLGQIAFNGVDSGSAKQEYGRIEGRIISTTAASEKGAVGFYTTATGTSTKQIDLLDTGGQYRGNNTNTAPPAGYIGEYISSYVSSVSLTSPTAKTITSISLTAGIWDISCGALVVMTGISTSASAGISTTTNTFEGNGGDQFLTTSLPLTAVTISFSVPAFRVTLSTTTIYYLIGQGTFSTGTGAAGGRISGTRVG